MSLSSRGQRALKPALPYWAKFAEGAGDLYDAETNPDGYVLMAVAESRGSFAKMMPRLNAVRDCAIEESTGAYTNMLGRTRIRSAFAAMTSRTVLGNKVHIDFEQLCISSGCGSVLMQLGMLLLDPGDAVLLPTPTYAALYNDLGTLAYGRVVDVPTESTGYRLTRSLLEDAYSRALQGGPVRMLLLLNPNNPLGIVHSEAELRMARAFCREKGMHLVADEIYANSVHDPVEADEAAVDVESQGLCGGSASLGARMRFRSIVEICAEDAGVLAPAAVSGSEAPSSASGKASFMGPDVHVLWGFSKDWAISGFRVGVLYTHNEALLTALGNVNYFTAVSNDTQDMLGAVLEDHAWCDGYLQHCRGQLRDAYGALTAILDASAIPYVRAQSGMFVWLDLRAMLPPSAAATSGSESDPDPFARERALTDELFAEARVLFTPGEACHAAEPGFYRCCFAWMPPAAVRVGFERLAAFAAKRRST